MKLKITHVLACMSAAVASACTGNYSDINRNPYEVDRDQMMADGYALSAAMKSLCSTVISTDVNTTQLTDVLLGGVCAGYYATSQTGFANTVDNFNPTDDWTRVLMSSDRIIPLLYSNLAELKTLSDEPEVTAIANIVKVTAMHRVTDTFGPIPYSQIGLDGKIQVPYDSQEAVYRLMFEQLNDAVEVLGNASGQLAANVDPIYNGDFKKWIKFANSLKLRLAMHIVYADRELAREMAESAVNPDKGGVLTDNTDNAQLPSTAFGKDGNPLLVSFRYNTPTHEDKTVCPTGGDSHAAADIICYMNGYNDPRREKYFTPASDGTYVGMISGPQNSSRAPGDYISFSKIRVNGNFDAQPVMYAAEAAFLRAEGALKGWNMNGTAESLYHEGIRLSLNEFGVASAYADYIQTTSQPAGHNAADGQMRATSTVSVKWSDDPSQHLEQILTQKWIALWLDPMNGWADNRRTGYPKLWLATKSANVDVDASRGARRTPFPQAEYNTNNANVQAAAAMIGGDSMGNDLWWALKN